MTTTRCRRATAAPLTSTGPCGRPPAPTASSWVRPVRALIYTELTQALNAWVQAYARQTCFRWEVDTAKSSYPSLLEQAIMPSATPATGGYGGSVSVTLESETQGARIYYTVDGSTPTLTSLAYTGPILISQTTTLKAMAVQTGMENSPVMTEIYTVTGDAGESFSPGMVALRTQDERQIVVRKSLVQNGKVSSGRNTAGLCGAADLGKTFADTTGHWSADRRGFCAGAQPLPGGRRDRVCPRQLHDARRAGYGDAPAWKD